jgi:excisionase family DNA binding protein
VASVSEKVITVTEAARLAGLTPAAIYKAIVRDRVRAFKLHGRWRLRREDVDSWRRQREKH